MSFKIRLGKRKSVIDADQGARSAADELRALRRENSLLKTENDILKKPRWFSCFGENGRTHAVFSLNSNVARRIALPDFVSIPRLRFLPNPLADSAFLAAEILTQLFGELRSRVMEIAGKPYNHATFRRGLGLFCAETTPSSLPSCQTQPLIQEPPTARKCLAPSLPTTFGIIAPSDLQIDSRLFLRVC